MGEAAQSIKPGQAVGAQNRYWVVQPQVWLDTKPGTMPELPGRLPPEIVSYLKLLPYTLNMPKVFGTETVSRTGRKTTQVWLLEKAPIFADGVGTTLAGKLMPSISESWKSANSMRQLNWLWQIANLWDDCVKQGVAQTLLTGDKIRVENGLVRILELLPDGDRTLSLRDLAQEWQEWQKQARLPVAATLDKLCQQIQAGTIETAEALSVQLDRALQLVGQKQFLTCNSIAISDVGPSRDGNEDACYPASGEPTRKRTGTDLSLAIVCDGVGGHQGGEVASNLAIDAIRQRIESVLENPEHRYPESIYSHIEASTCVANDRISMQNDAENRQERARMGTTMVLGLVYGHEAYIAHVGDSRAYRITRTGCHQVTLDDDLATRDVRLGYSLYREALSRSSSGSLYQALGMNSSTTLHPTVSRLLVDEECIFLLCSDGLSDRDRVEEHWQSEILPVLEGRIDLATACQRVIEIANTCNGHDNATVALLHCQVKQPVETGQTTAAVGDLLGMEFATPQRETLLIGGPDVRDNHQAAAKPPFIIWIIAFAALLGVGGAIGWWMLSRPPSPANAPPTLSPSSSSTPSTDPPTPAASPESSTTPASP
jgi:serine/threonine protein phosphatase PrpC